MPCTAYPQVDFAFRQFDLNRTEPVNKLLRVRPRREYLLRRHRKAADDFKRPGLFGLLHRRGCGGFIHCHVPPDSVLLLLGLSPNRISPGQTVLKTVEAAAPERFEFGNPGFHFHEFLHAQTGRAGAAPRPYDRSGPASSSTFRWLEMAGPDMPCGFRQHPDGPAAFSQLPQNFPAHRMAQRGKFR